MNKIFWTQQRRGNLISKMKKRLEGMPSNSLETASEVAKSRKQKGFTLTLDQPCYMAVMTYANDQALRKKVYLAYASRASKNFR